ncbi:hypothetical protein [Pedobacter miscanthi]|uniref:Uncharacterized protein n=1 Tax=Pedobacter miscanthi TaxID=2259170 RepID=A0A366LD52_9SPHI|nr:hypothetical protein [Pedobacter miscanthi]RBQ11776.1 hypothetical protein DRW42_00425 [Pedobacter miscanthi]
MADKESKKDQQNEVLTDRERLAQTALGNPQGDKPSIDNNDELLSIPKTSGTGSNLPSAAPHSLIVHEDENGKKRYHEGPTGSPIEGEE